MLLRASRTVQLRTARMILGCPSRSSSDVIRADLGLQLLSSHRDIAKLKWQHRLHALPEDRLELTLYARGSPGPSNLRGKTRRSLSQVVAVILRTLPVFHPQSLGLPRRDFFRDLSASVHDKDHAAFFATLTSKPELALYNRVYESPGTKEYLLRHVDGHHATQIKFQLWSRTSMLRHHDVRFRDQPGYDVEDRICAACQQHGSVESVFHVLLHCMESAARGAALRAQLVALPVAQVMPPALSDEDGVVALLRDYFMGGSPEAARAVDAFLRDVISFRALCIEHFGGYACICMLQMG